MFSFPFFAVSEFVVKAFTLKAEFFTSLLADQFHLVADDKENTSNYKVVVMPHVTMEILDRFLSKLRLEVWVNE